MRSTRLQLAVTFLALAVSAALFAYLGPPPAESYNAFSAVHWGDARTLHRHLHWGTDPNARWRTGTPLLWVPSYGDPYVMTQLLLDHGADPDTKNPDDGRTFLHYAAWLRRQDISRLLLDHGADVNARDKEGRTPLDCAFSREEPSPQATETVEFLRSRGGVSGTELPKPAP